MILVVAGATLFESGWLSTLPSHWLELSAFVLQGGRTSGIFTGPEVFGRFETVHEPEDSSAQKGKGVIHTEPEAVHRKVGDGLAEQVQSASSDGLGSHVPDTGIQVDNDLDMSEEDVQRRQESWRAGGWQTSKYTARVSFCKRERESVALDIGEEAFRSAKRRHLVDEESDVLLAPQPALVFLSETKCKKRKCEILKEKLNFFGVNVDSQGKGGGLMLLWNKDLNLVVQSFSSSHIDACVSNEDAVYRLDRGSIQVTRVLSLLGATNVKLPIPFEFVLIGRARRWDGKQGGVQRKKLFRFEAMWARSADCEELIRTLWNRETEGDVTARLLQRQQTVRDGLIGWDKSTFDHVRSRVKELEEQLSKLDNKPITAEGRLMRSRIRNELEEFLSREELMWKQRGKAQWLREGDRNTPFFHARASARRSKNSIARFVMRMKFDYSHPKRGLRQGDPLSPYLFPFCVEILNHLLVKAESRGELRGIAISRQGPRVSHLLFEDDTLIFCQASEEAMYCVRRVLKEFEAVSGMVVNLDKSEIAFSCNTPEQQKEDLVRILGVRVVERHTKYLGLPALVGRSKKAIFQNLKDRIWKCLQS
ncbi:UNVERIFIED_CONTAM: putative mitochondrial protein [Sesamum latifolium]|uniref:Mitochondrial protein n=1 Tax=Sesamum latifolium TaxID=2727402 RepID=A0AAW2X5Y6_9LAMI